MLCNFISFFCCNWLGLSSSYIEHWVSKCSCVIDGMLNYWEYIFSGASKNVQVKACPHPGYFGGLCFRCGKPQDEENVSGVAFGYIHKVLQNVEFPYGTCIFGHTFANLWALYCHLIFHFQLHLHIALSLSSFTNLGGLLKCRAWG